MSRARAARSVNRRTRPAQVIALGSGKGGVGRTTLAVELARALTRHDQSVLLVDVDDRAQGLATLLELDAPAPTVRTDERDAFDTAPCETSIDGAALVALDEGPRLLHLTDRAEALDRVRELMLGLHDAAFDWVIVDMPAGFAHGTTALFAGADVPLLVGTAEPASLVSSTAYLRACVLASVAQQQNPDMTWRIQTLAGRAPHAWTFAELHDALDEDGQVALEEACERLTIGLVLNKVREGSENEQATALCHAWALLLGVWPRFLGGVTYDDRRWFFARRLAPANHHPRDESVAGDTDRLARKLVGLDWQRWNTSPPCLPCVDATHDARLFIGLGDDEDPEVRPAYRRLWEGYRREAGLISHVMDLEMRHDVVDQLEGAYRRLAADDAPGADEETDSSAAVTRSSPALRQHPGQRIRLARMRQGLGLRELSLRTRVGVKHINAIEACIVRELPKGAYLEAYLDEIANTLGLEADGLIDDYVAYVDEASE